MTRLCPLKYTSDHKESKHRLPLMCVATKKGGMVRRITLAVCGKSGEEPTMETSGTFQKFIVAFQWFLEHYMYFFIIQNCRMYFVYQEASRLGLYNV